LVLQRLARMGDGRLLLEDGVGRNIFGHGAKDGHGAVTLTVLDPRFYTAVASTGAVGAADAYIEGYWTCNDLTGLVRLLLKNREVLEGLEGGLARLAQPVRRVYHWLNRNTRRGSRKNISAHYDLGNDFFKLWLDDTMMYSSAIFEREDMSLHEASVAKLDRISRKLELSPADHVLEIGTGWGGFALHAARNYGCRVTTTTISREQYLYAKARVDDLGLSDRVTLLFQDYRELAGRYDKAVSIEMIEAIGHENLDSYFARCSGLLKEEGMMLVQAITIADQRYAASLKSVDFIQRYIFPGGFLPSTTAILQSVTYSSDMRLYHLEDIGAHYARTLSCWRERFRAKLSTIRALGYPEKFLRMWEYYYCYCEGAFLERATGTAQLLLVKPGCRREPLITPL
ncbi:MAG TPA: cyclopropane-fatty-acyl-phospholipid synthase family protein, partial [Woeseiaceae bacterium]|nr:cyclopropane-fatty-acyl-phospholipid synthase family protein [Woeseiaceae bacterium]